MATKVKFALLAVSAGMIALSTGSCFFRLIGDQLADWLIFRQIP